MKLRTRCLSAVLSGVLFIVVSITGAVLLGGEKTAASQPSSAEEPTFLVEERVTRREGNSRAAALTETGEAGTGAEETGAEETGAEKTGAGESGAEETGAEEAVTAEPEAEEPGETGVLLKSSVRRNEHGKRLNREADETLSAEAFSEIPPESGLTGIEAFFDHKLIVDPVRTEKYLNVRKSMRADSEILAVLYPSELTEYVHVHNNWYEVYVDGSETGYVSGDYVLADQDACEAARHHVGYRVMCRDFGTVFYEAPDDSVDGILSCDMGESFRVSGITDGYYRVEGLTEYYPVLYVRCEDVLLYYEYLGLEQENGLSAETEEYLHSLDLGDCEKEAEELSALAASEKQRMEDEKRAEEAAQAEAARNSAEAKARARMESAKQNGLGLSEATVANVDLSPELTAYTLNLSAQYGVDSAVIFAVMYQESRFDPWCTSGHGAIGLMQIVPRYHSARIAALGVTDLYDPTSNILVGTDLLADYYYQEGSNWTRALTRYRYGTADGSSDYAELIFSYVPMFR